MHYNKRPVPFELYEIGLREASDDELVEISRETGIGLSLDEMHTVRDHFNSLDRDPTDIELQAVGQAWSEHCCYKTSKPILRDFVFGIDAPQNMLVISEDAGVVEFDDEHAYVVALESHNHPSAIEPYGGAATGIGGIVRDVVCMGAQPVAFIDPLFFGPLEYPMDELPGGVKHPKYLFSGVVSGIRDYGNRIGIPTVAGMVYFHEGYVGNCLVNVGCVGIARKEDIIRSRVQEPGDIFILVGGRTGRDGIHGVTFASAELTEESEEGSRGAVQLGDPITKEPLIHACLEVNQRKLLHGMKDLGGGGLSCVVGEMALAAGYGAEVDLERVPLKEEGLLPWEIWVSESQERFMLAVTPDNLDEVLYVFERWDLDATVIGKVIPEKILRVRYQGELIFEMDLEFLTGGPEYCREYSTKEDHVGIDHMEPVIGEPEDYAGTLLRILSSSNIANREWIIRQYDHEVRANTVIKPLQGKIGCTSHGDASVIKPLEHSYKGLAITSDVNPSYMSIDPYWGAASAIDEVCRNLVSVGAVPHSFADCLNFGNPEKADRLGDFYEASRGLGYMAKALGVPFVSGNVSFYNETPFGTVPPTPTILGVGIVEDIRACVTSDLKQQGNPLYLVGDTMGEVGGSVYAQVIGDTGSISVPKTDPEILQNSMNAVLTCINREYVASCHDLSDGGLAASICEMMLGGDIGAHLDISVMKALRNDFKLFSESNTRWLIEVKKGSRNEFEEVMKKGETPCYMMGSVEDNGQLLIDDKDKCFIELSINNIRDTWEKPIWEHMG